MKKHVLPILCALFSALLLLTSCADGASDGKNEQTQVQALDFSQLEISEYITLGEYKNLTVSLQSQATSRSDAIWQAVVNEAVVKEYPEQQVNYYVSQSRDKYTYMAKQADMSYEELLASLSVTEAQILDEAQKLTKEDLVMHAIIRAESISLTDAEKTQHFDKYVQKYVESYGYREEYVRENLTEEIYGSMLYDKMLEFLISQNAFKIIN